MESLDKTSPNIAVDVNNCMQRQRDSKWKEFHDGVGDYRCGHALTQCTSCTYSKQRVQVHSHNVFHSSQDRRKQEKRSGHLQVKHAII